MKIKIIFFACSLLLIIGFWGKQISAKDIHTYGNKTNFAGVWMSSTPVQSIETTFSKSLLDTLYSFPTPGTWPAGLAWDGQYFWNCDADSQMIFKINMTGDIISSFELPDSAESGGGLEWDGNYLWFADEESAILFKIDTTTGLAIEQFHLPSFGQTYQNGFGLAWDGQYLWHSEYSASAMIYKLDPQNGQVVSSFIPPKSKILGITWADGFLYGVNIEFDLSGGILYQFEPSSGIVLDSTFWEVPYPLGLVWDGQYFWNVSSNILFGGNQRIYQVSNPITSVDNSSVNKVSRFTLLQNYPNPFNPTTTLEFSLAAHEFVSLKIYNLLGQEVTTLVSERLTPGNYKYVWDASGYSSGVYYYRLAIHSDKFDAANPSASSGNRFVQTKKLLVLK